MSSFATLADVLTITGKEYTGEEMERIVNCFDYFELESTGRLVHPDLNERIGLGTKEERQEQTRRIIELGKKYGKTPAQIILRWHTQMGFVVIPGSKNTDHIKDNLNILDFALTDEEMAEIAKFDKDQRYYNRTEEQLVQFAAWKPSFEVK